MGTRLLLPDLSTQLITRPRAEYAFLRWGIDARCTCERKKKKFKCKQPNDCVHARFSPEVMAPLADAMRFVHSEQSDTRHLRSHDAAFAVEEQKIVVKSGRGKFARWVNCCGGARLMQPLQLRLHADKRLRARVPSQDKTKTKWERV
jgi:hypothetical protein